MDECREPSAADAANRRSVIDNNERQAEMRKSEMKAGVKKFRQPVEIEPPDGIGEKFRYRKCPGLAIDGNLSPGNFRNRLRRITVDQVKLGPADCRVVRGLAVMR